MQLQFFLKALLVWYYISVQGQMIQLCLFICQRSSPQSHTGTIDVSVVGKLMNLPESLHVCTNSILMCTVVPAFYNISH